MSPSSFSLYVHIPYCLSKCPYCDFNSYGLEKGQVRLEQSEEEKYLNALISELKQYAKQSTWASGFCSSVFFGGGTPSLFSPQSIAYFLEVLRQELRISSDAEITLEANPGTIQEELGVERLGGFKAAGVNRVSMGVQSFSRQKLKTLGRLHSGEDAISALENIRRAGFSNFSFDLIFGVPEESTQAYLEDLKQAIAINPPHLSCYLLTIESGTEFGRQFKAGKFRPLQDELQAEMYALTQQTLNAAGYTQYEISNYSLPERRSEHNLNYWRRGSYLGLGAGAHSFDGLCGEFGRRWSNLPGPALYCARAKSSGQAQSREELVSREQAQIEFFMLGLRSSEGICPDRLEKCLQVDFKKTWGELCKKLSSEGLLNCSDKSLCLSPLGFRYADSVIESFVCQGQS